MGKLLFQSIEFPRGSSWGVGTRYVLTFTTNGNLQYWDVRSNRIIWESRTHGERLAMQSDGNLAIYDGAGRCVWATHTAGNQNAYFAAQDDGNLVIYTADLQKAIWDLRAAVR